MSLALRLETFESLPTLIVRLPPLPPAGENLFVGSGQDGKSSIWALYATTAMLWHFALRHHLSDSTEEDKRNQAGEFTSSFLATNSNERALELTSSPAHLLAASFSQSLDRQPIPRGHVRSSEEEGRWRYGYGLVREDRESRLRLAVSVRPRPPPPYEAVEADCSSSLSLTGTGFLPLECSSRIRSPDSSLMHRGTSPPFVVPVGDAC